MKTPLLAGLFIGALACVLPASSARAQAPPRMKMTTDIPPGIAAPGKVETRPGTLEFFDGFPNDASAEKLSDNLDFQRAVQAYLLALPPVSMAGLCEGLSGRSVLDFDLRQSHSSSEQQEDDSYGMVRGLLALQ